MINDNRPFPIQAESYRGKDGHMVFQEKCTIPWWLAEEAFKYYHEHWRDQSLEKLAERGGFGRPELLRLLRREGI